MEIATNIAQISHEMAEMSKIAPLSAVKAQLIAVSKRQPAAKILAAIEAGQRHFGENKLQEALEHWEDYRETISDLTLHYIGPLQSNKVGEVVRFFNVIHSVDRPKLARTIATECEKQQKRPDCYIQVNTGEEPQKAGALPSELEAFMKLCRDELGLPIVGLMCIPPAEQNPAPHFALLRQLAETYQLPRLSMGMSGDWQTALRLGATDIRLGTALFGERDAQG